MNHKKSGAIAPDGWLFALTTNSTQRAAKLWGHLFVRLVEHIFPGALFTINTCRRRRSVIVDSVPNTFDFFKPKLPDQSICVVFVPMSTLQRRALAFAESSNLVPTLLGDPGAGHILSGVIKVEVMHTIQSRQSIRWKHLLRCRSPQVALPPAKYPTPEILTPHCKVNNAMKSRS